MTQNQKKLPKNEKIFDNKFLKIEIMIKNWKKFKTWKFSKNEKLFQSEKCSNA